jgi:manganese-transporting P-type ATPase
MLCLLLWSLDDYWYYSALTGLMLLFFEGVLAKQRLVSLENLRAMKRTPILMYVFRCGKWEVSSSEDIVPGDVISLSFTPTADAIMGRRGHQTFAVESEKIVPCDALIIRGSCVVNEAMLTGESVPQVKESLRVASRDDEELVEAKVGGTVCSCLNSSGLLNILDNLYRQ